MAISQEWTDVVDGQVDSDSPVNQILMMAIKDDLYHLKYWLGKDYTAADNHDHDDINSKSVVLGDNVVTQAKMADAAIGIAELKLTEGTWRGLVNTGNSIQIDINTYSHMPRIKCDDQYLADTVWRFSNATWTTWKYQLYLANNSGTSETFDASWFYHSASPPQEVWIEFDYDSDSMIQIWKSEHETHMEDCPIKKLAVNSAFVKLEKAEIEKAMKKFPKWQKKDYTHDLKAGDILNEKDEISGEIKSIVKEKLDKKSKE